jgi:hypothetical protein
MAGKRSQSQSIRGRETLAIYNMLSPARRTRLVQAANRIGRSVVAPRKWVLSDVYPVIYVMG